MAREIVTLTHLWCDVCLQDGDKVEAEELPPVTIGKLKPRLLAMCERHRKELFDPFRVVVADLGQIIPSSVQLTLSGGSDAPIASAGEQGIWPCPVPDCEHHEQPYTHKQSLRNHAREKHDSTITQLLSKYGVPENSGSLSAQAQARRSEQVRSKREECPECGRVYDFPKYQQPSRALGVHRAKNHGVAGENKRRVKKAS